MAVVMSLTCLTPSAFADPYGYGGAETNPVDPNAIEGEAGISTGGSYRIGISYFDLANKVKVTSLAKLSKTKSSIKTTEDAILYNMKAVEKEVNNTYKGCMPKLEPGALYYINTERDNLYSFEVMADPGYTLSSCSNKDVPSILVYKGDTISTPANDVVETIKINMSDKNYVFDGTSGAVDGVSPGVALEALKHRMLNVGSGKNFKKLTGMDTEKSVSLSRSNFALYLATYMGLAKASEYSKAMLALDSFINTLINGGTISSVPLIVVEDIARYGSSTQSYMLSLQEYHAMMINADKKTCDSYFKYAATTNTYPQIDILNRAHDLVSTTPNTHCGKPVNNSEENYSPWKFGFWGCIKDGDNVLGIADADCKVFFTSSPIYSNYYGQIFNKLTGDKIYGQAIYFGLDGTLPVTAKQTEFSIAGSVAWSGSELGKTDKIVGEPIDETAYYAFKVSSKASAANFAEWYKTYKDEISGFIVTAKFSDGKLEKTTSPQGESLNSSHTEYMKTTAGNTLASKLPSKYGTIWTGSYIDPMSAEGDGNASKSRASFKCTASDIKKILNGDISFLGKSDRYLKTSKSETGLYSLKVVFSLTIIPIDKEGKDFLKGWKKNATATSSLIVEFKEGTISSATGGYTIESDNNFGPYTEGASMSERYKVVLSLPSEYNIELYEATNPDRETPPAVTINFIHNSDLNSQPDSTYTVSLEQAAATGKRKELNAAFLSALNGTNASVSFTTAEDIADLRKWLEGKTSVAVKGMVSGLATTSTFWTHGVELNYVLNGNTVMCEPKSVDTAENIGFVVETISIEPEIVVVTPEAKGNYNVTGEPVYKEIDLVDTDGDKDTMDETYDMIGNGEKATITTTLSMNTIMSSNYQELVENATKCHVEFLIGRKTSEDKGSLNTIDPDGFCYITSGFEHGDFTGIDLGGVFKWEQAEGDGNNSKQYGLISDDLRALQYFDCSGGDRKIVFVDDFKDTTYNGGGYVGTARQGNLTLNSANSFTLRADYKVVINMRIVDKEDRTYYVSWEPICDTATVSWEAVPTYKWTSELQTAWAELKSNQPLAEEYEAMSGIPTTRNLYAAVGGDEFLVQVSCKVNSKVAATRELTYSFTKNILCSKNPKCSNAVHSRDDCVKIGRDGCTPHPSVTQYKSAGSHRCHWEANEEEEGGGHYVCDEEPTPVPIKVLDPRDCSAAGWSRQYGYTTTTCGACGGVASISVQTSTQVCLGQGSGSFSGYENTSNRFDVNDEDLKEISWDWKHCNCHCKVTDHAWHECESVSYTPTWTSTVTGLNFMTIKDLKVWRLERNHISGLDDLTDIDEYYGHSATEKPTIYYKKTTDYLSSDNLADNGIIVYNWHPEQGDYVDLKDTSQEKTGNYNSSGAGKLNTDLNLRSDVSYCRQSSRNIRDTYNYLKSNYLDHILSGGTYNREKMTVISDYIILAGSNGASQSIYYHDYEVAIDNSLSMSTEQTSGISNVYKHYHLDNKFGSSISTQASNCRVKYNALCNAAYEGRGFQKSMLTTVNVADFLWDSNKLSAGGGGHIAEAGGIHVGGYNGNYYTDLTDKYEKDKRSNVNLDIGKHNLAILNIQRQDGTSWHGEPGGFNFYGRSAYHGKNGYSPYNNMPDEYKPALRGTIETTTGPYIIMNSDIDIENTRINGLYGNFSSEVFYKLLCDYGSAGPQRANTVSEWEGGELDYGFTETTKYCPGSSYEINPIVVFNPSATQFNCFLKETVNIKDDRLEEYIGRNPEYNLESGGVLHYELLGLFNDPYTECIATPTHNINKGYHSPGTSALDVYEWCAHKWVVFNTDCVIDVNGDGSLANDKIYRAGTSIELNKNVTDYLVYFVQEGEEGKDLEVTFWMENINDPSQAGVLNNPYYYTNIGVTNEYGKQLGSHGDCASYNTYNIVGMIGNLTVSDTGDFRYSNFFKQPTPDGKWIVPNIVRTVDPSKQKSIVIERYDIFGKEGATLPNRWNTYGSQSHKKDADYKYLPLQPSYNNINGYKNDAVRIGYDVMLDIETIGDYYTEDSFLRVDYSYYGIDSSKKAVPLDVYMLKDGKYVLINDFYNKKEVYNYPIVLNWDNTNIRRGYTSKEAERTAEGAKATGYKVKLPGGTYLVQGNCNTLKLDGGSRTFIGDYYYHNSDFSGVFNDDDYKNKGEGASAGEFYKSSQKWYFTCGLPSSAVFVYAGEKPTEANIKKCQNFAKIYATAYIQAHGDTWDLIHDGTLTWSDAGIPAPPKKDWPVVPKDPSEPQPEPGATPPETPPTIIVEIEIPPASSADDVNTVGTH